MEREADLARLESGAEAALKGSSSFYAVVGAVGVGKTRLLEQARQLAEEQGLRVLRARASELEREYPFGVVRQIFGPLLSTATLTQKKVWLSGAAADARVALGFTSAPRSDTGEFAVLHGLYWLTANVCLSGPVMFAIDDLHWSDEPSLRFLTFIQQRLDELHVQCVTTSRPDVPGAAQSLLERIIGHDSCQIIRPAPLSAAGASTLLEYIFRAPVERDFAAVCHAATAGNPLWVTELALRLVDEKMQATATVAELVQRVGPQAVARRVVVELSRLPPEDLRLAESITVLGGKASVAESARLAELTFIDAAKGIEQLVRCQLLRPFDSRHRQVYEFVHPVVHGAIYDGMTIDRRAVLHNRAIGSLLETGAAPDKVATHLLKVPPGLAQEVDAPLVLRQAAASALVQGAPEAAHAYLQRCLEEPLDEKVRLVVLTDAISVALRVDTAAALEYFDRGVRIAPDAVSRARLVAAIGVAPLIFGRDGKTAIHVLSQAIADLPGEYEDLRRFLEANLVSVPFMVTGCGELILRQLPRMRDLPDAGSGIGALMLDSIISRLEFALGAPDSVQRAEGVLADGRIFDAIIRESTGASTGAFSTVALHDPDEGIRVFSEALERARRKGCLAALPYLFWRRGTSWIDVGNLNEAENDLIQGLELSGRRINFDFGSAVVQPTLARVYLAQGRIDDAAICFERDAFTTKLPSYGWLWVLLQSRAEVLYAQGRLEESLEAALSAGERIADHFTASGDRNPAVAPWRSQAALCFHALGNATDARKLAEEEVALARNTGAPHTLGRSLRIAGIVNSGATALEYLRESVSILQESSARMEYAESAIAYGSTLRRRGARTQARGFLADGLENALKCDAAPLVERARTELHIAGARPRRQRLTGPEALTASERRVARFAANGASNREIAEQLFITEKTVEAHLGSAYRKLGIKSRRNLAAAIEGHSESTP